MSAAPNLPLKPPVHRFEPTESIHFGTKTIVFVPCDLRRSIDSLNFIARLAARYPSDRIDVVATTKTSALFEHFPSIHTVWRFENIAADSRTDSVSDTFENALSNWSAKLSLAKQIAKVGYNRAIFLEHSHYKPLLAMLIGIRARWGFSPHWPLTLTRTLKLVHEQNSTPLNLAQWLALANLGATSQNPVQGKALTPLVLLRRPSMEPSYARRKFGVSALMPVLVFVAGHSRSMPPDHKDWPNRYWFELALQAQERFGQTQIVFIGDTADRSRATEIATLIGPLAHNLCGMTNLYETMALMTGAMSVFGNDHVMLHLSSALGVPNVGIFGGTDPRARAPKSIHHRTLWLHLECSPCQGPTCQLGRALCLERLTPRDALNALELNHVNTQLL
jgi:heptosyltransferase II